MERLILGTAGHIDHGKTTLVRALTGVDTDRLPEEKRRGITIDLGFAALDLAGGTHFGIVDVPGHEAFVRNMLAGASGVDVALLVVAADEGVMPQTREHIAILELLDVPTLVVALTKADLVDDEWRELAHEDVRALLARTPWADAPILPCSGATGAGLDALRNALARAAGDAPRRGERDLLCMPVDRVFTVHGTGTVATGTIWSGTVHRDDQIRLMPADTAVRVRSVQSHGAVVERAGAGERAALALAGIDRSDVRRGDTLVTGAGWRAAACLTVRLAVLADAARPVSARQRVRVHLGTAEVMARVALSGRSAIAPGESAWAQLLLERPLVARARDRVVIRSYSPVTTIAGAVVAEPAAVRRRRIDPATAEHLQAIIAGAPAAAITAVAALGAEQGVDRAELPILTGLAVSVVDAADADELHFTATRVFTRAVLQRATDAVAAVLDAWHANAPLEPGCDRDTLRRALPANAHPDLLPAAVARLSAAGALTVTGALYARAGWQPEISGAHAALIESAREAYAAAGLAALAVDELPASLATSPDCAAVLRLLERNGELTAVEPARYVSTAFLDVALHTARSALADRADLGPADFRAVWGLSRKHLIPLLEYLDRTGITERRGDTRAFVVAAGGNVPD